MRRSVSEQANSPSISARRPHNQPLLHIARIKALAAAERVSSVEISGQRLMLHRNGDYILLEGRRFPRLKAASPAGKLAETIDLLRTL